VAGLRREFDEGTATNSTLMTLIMHDIRNGATDRARPCFEALRKRAPDSPFVRRMSVHFAGR